MQDRLQRLIDAKSAHGRAIGSVVPSGHRCGPIKIGESRWNELEAVWDEEKAARAALVPTEQDAINLMHDCYQRLKELGWNDAIYCPKDGSEFDAIEAGSTGIHPCHYSGEWPDGHWWVADAGDIWPSRPILYRVTEKEIANLVAARERFRALAQGIEAGTDETLQAAQPEGQEPGSEGMRPDTTRTQ